MLTGVAPALHGGLIGPEGKGPENQMMVGQKSAFDKPWRTLHGLPASMRVPDEAGQEAGGAKTQASETCDHTTHYRGRMRVFPLPPPG